MTPPKYPKKQFHGLYALENALARVDDMDHWLSELGEAGQALREKRERMIADQGGRAKISEGELMTIDGTIAAFVIQQSIGHFIGNMECPVNRVKRTVFPVVREWLPYFAAVREGVKDLSELRKNRFKPEPVALTEYMKSKADGLGPSAVPKGNHTPTPTSATTDGETLNSANTTVVEAPPDAGVAPE